MTEKDIDLKTIIDSFRTSENPVVFIGAGISRAAPSSIPLFSELIEAYIDALDQEINVISTYGGVEAKEIKEKICNLPIEELFADLKFVFHNLAFDPLKWMNDRTPNINHKLISLLVQELDIKTILTPNFDLLLEKVLPDFHSIAEMKVYTKHAMNGINKGSVPHLCC